MIYPESIVLLQKGFSHFFVLFLLKEGLSFNRYGVIRILFRHWSLVAMESREKAHEPGKITCVRSFGKVGRLLFCALSVERTPRKSPYGCRKYQWKGPPFTGQKKIIYFLKKMSQQIPRTRAQTKCWLTYCRPWPKWVPPCCPWKTQWNI